MIIQPNISFNGDLPTNSVSELYDTSFYETEEDDDDPGADNNLVTMRAPNVDVAVNSNTSVPSVLEDSLSSTCTCESFLSCGGVQENIPLVTICSTCSIPRESLFMMCCDQCLAWHHGDCVGISLPEAELMVSQKFFYKCPDCLAVGTHPCPICPKSFPIKGHNALWMHINQVHVSRSLFPPPLRFSANTID